MGKLVFAGAVSHAPGATGWPEKADPGQKERFYQSAQELGRRIIASKPDVIVGLSNDHVLNYNLRNFPDFAVGIAQRHSGPGEWFKSWLKVPDYELQGSPKLAGMLYNGLVRLGHNIANHPGNFEYDDNMSVPLTLTGLTTAGIPFIPVMMNCTVPPVISSETAYEIGKSFREVILNSFPDDVRVAFLATGGLSHEPGGPKYFVIDEAFDRWVMDHLARSDHQTIIREVTYEKMEAAGSGGTSELLAWFVAMGAAGECKCEVLCYEAIAEWRCGMGVVDWQMEIPFVPEEAVSAQGGESNGIGTRQ